MLLNRAFINATTHSFCHFYCLSSLYQLCSKEVQVDKVHDDYLEKLHITHERKITTQPEANDSSETYYFHPAEAFMFILLLDRCTKGTTELRKSIYIRLCCKTAVEVRYGISLYVKSFVFSTILHLIFLFNFTHLFTFAPR